MLRRLNQRQEVSVAGKDADVLDVPAVNLLQHVDGKRHVNQSRSMSLRRLLKDSRSVSERPGPSSGFSIEPQVPDLFSNLINLDVVADGRRVVGDAPYFLLTIVRAE